MYVFIFFFFCLKSTKKRKIHECFNHWKKYNKLWSFVRMTLTCFSEGFCLIGTDSRPYLYSICIHSSETFMACNSCINHSFDQLPCIVWRKIDLFLKWILLCGRHSFFLHSRSRPLVVILSLVVSAPCELVTLSIQYIARSILYDAIIYYDSIIKWMCEFHYR